MKILLINKFLYNKGGDGVSTLATGKLLTKKGHKVYYFGMKSQYNEKYQYSDYFVNNIEYDKIMSFKNKISAVVNIIYSYEAKKKLQKMLNIIQPDIIHLNNFAHQISPSILHTIKKYKIPVIMTCHDYKLVCANYLMYNKSKVCEKCKNGKYYNCLINKCIKNSYLKSFINTIEMYFHHDILHIYDNINFFMSPSIFLKQKIKYMGFNKNNVVNLPNFININDYEPYYNNSETYFCYIGRLSYEKGIITLINSIKNIDIKLNIIGEGPLSEYIKKFLRQNNINNVFLLGYLKGDNLKKEIKNSIAVIVPSEWYENNPFTVLEAFAFGKPVIASKIGGLSEMVIDNETGYTFEPKNEIDLNSKICKMISNKHNVYAMGKKARKFVEENFNSEVYYNKLLAIYKKVMLKQNEE